MWLHGFLTEIECKELDGALGCFSGPGSRSDSNASSIDLLAHKAISHLAHSIGPEYKPVRMVAFEKNEQANWSVPWHQDRVVAVSNRADIPGFSNWSHKAGVWHCEPPLEILNRMVFARIHLDNCDARNGAMEISLGSHALGKIQAERAAGLATKFHTESTDARRGDVLLLPMLTLHRSPAAQIDTRRRVVRIDFSPDDLPAPLAWAI